MQEGCCRKRRAHALVWSGLLVGGWAAFLGCGTAQARPADPMSSPIAQQQAQQSAAEDCPSPAQLGRIDRETLTNRLFSPTPPPSVIVVDRDRGPVTKTLEFETDLDSGFVENADNANFRVRASLMAPDNSSVEDGAVAAAAAASTRSIVARVCIDPSPPTGRLAVGEYRLHLRFVDSRIPETSMSLDVRVGDPASGIYWAMVAALTLLGAGTLIGVVAMGALRSRRRVREELRLALPWLRPLLVVLVAAMAWSAWRFPDTEHYDVWSSSTQGVSDFARFAWGQVNGFVALLVGAFALVRRWQNTVTEVADTVDRPQDVPATPAAPAEEHRRRVMPAPSAAAPARADQLGSPRRVRWVLPAAVAIVVVLGTALVSLGQGGGQPDRGAEPQPTTTSTVATATTVTVRIRPLVFASLKAGETRGADTVAALRAAGFTVFDYLVCSNSVRTPGALRQVRATETHREIVGLQGATAASTAIRSPTPLDVLVANGAACN
jgi:hypothetical protein